MLIDGKQLHSIQFLTIKYYDSIAAAARGANDPCSAHRLDPSFYILFFGLILIDTFLYG